MRSTRLLGTFSYNRKVENNNGQVGEDSESPVYVTHRADRSEIIKTVRDPSGWRKPTGYMATVWDNHPLHCSLVQKVTYDNPQLDRDAGSRITMSGVSGLLEPGYAEDPGDFPQNLINRATTQALAKAVDSKINVGTTMAEIDQSIGMIADRARKLATSYHALRRGDFAKAAKAIGLTNPRKSGKGIAESTLEVQYGWRPLMSDIAGAYDELTRPVRGKGMLIKVVSRTSDSSKRPLKEHWVSRDGDFRSYSLSTFKYECQVILWYEVSDPELLISSSIGLQNPFAIAWELVPFSFLIDWLVPVGNVLSGMTATTGLTFKGGTVTTRTTSNMKKVFEVNSEVKFGQGTPQSGTKSSSGSGFGSARYFVMRRNALDESPLPRFYWKNPISGEHALNALALLRAR